jgi:hypothetical protein
MTGRFLFSRAARRSVIIGATLLITLLTATGQAAARACETITGDFTLAAGSGTCTSPVGICMTATFSGSLTGTSTFTATSVRAVGVTGVVVITGTDTLVTDEGTLLTESVIISSTTGEGAFTEVMTIAGGTGAYEGASGVIRVQGTFSQGAGGGEYVGDLCLP